MGEKYDTLKIFLLANVKRHAKIVTMSDKKLLENFTAPREKIKPMCDYGICDFAVMAKAATSPRAQSKRSDACRAACTPLYNLKKSNFLLKNVDDFSTCAF